MSAPEQQLITSGPGLEGKGAEPGLRAGENVPVDSFRGDPTRVIGHPANQTNEAAGAYGRQLSDQERGAAAPEGAAPISEGQATEWGGATLHGMGVPSPAQQQAPAPEAPRQ